jgi:hypothetical protein
MMRRFAQWARRNPEVVQPVVIAALMISLAVAALLVLNSFGL